MKIRFIMTLTLAVLLGGYTNHASAIPVDSVFASVPRHILPLLDKTSKLDLLDLYNSGIEARAENIYGGVTRLISKTDKSLLLQTSGVGTWQLKILASESENFRILCLHTLKAQGHSSILNLYDKHWNAVKCELPKLSWENFYVPDSDFSPTRLQSLCSILKELPIQITLSDSTDAVVYALSIDALPKEDRIDIQRCIHSVLFHLNKGKFEMIDSKRPL